MSDQSKPAEHDDGGDAGGGADDGRMKQRPWCGEGAEVHDQVLLKMGGRGDGVEQFADRFIGLCGFKQRRFTSGTFGGVGFQRCPFFRRKSAGDEGIDVFAKPGMGVDGGGHGFISFCEIYSCVYASWLLALLGSA